MIEIATLQFALELVFTRSTPQRHTGDVSRSSQQMTRDRLCQEQERYGDCHLDPCARRRFGKGNADKQQAATCYSRLGGGMHAHEKIRQAQNAKRRDQAEPGARYQEEG
ncbi:hypothetical protein V1479_05770 [Mesorhizobium sediminum]|uniref:Uncharacterized protein n=1 Tax=Neoaquamicrobium sediminum TaxID=1849104 RepID=A0ABV3WQ66_9HYPH